jgi:UDP-3-O-acyl N-acetylglucosamine deacetylase
VIEPGEVGRGLVFVFNGVEIPVNPGAISTNPVHPAFVGMPARCSAVGTDETTVWLIEHVLSALVGLGITNAVIGVDHCELPILDGSSLGFVEAIRKVGTEDQGVVVEPMVIAKPVRIERGDAWIEALPAKGCSYEYTIEYGTDSPIKAGTVRWDGDADDYADRIAPARTFCLEREAEALVGAGLFSHVEPGEMLVFGDGGVIDNELRDADECGLHKLLDLIGDVALVGRPIIGEIRAYKSGHALAHEFVRVVTNAQ